MIAHVWEIRDPLDPLGSPVIDWIYGQLSLPGIEGTVTDKTVRQFGPQFVYVSDSVLQYYEERPDKYSICPEIGSVSYRNQWSVSCCQHQRLSIVDTVLVPLNKKTPIDVSSIRVARVVQERVD